MKKVRRSLISLLFALLTLLACQQEDSSLSLKEEIKEVNIFRANEFKKEDSDLIVSSSDTNNRKIFETVKKIISNASKQEGVVETTKPSYDLEIIYEDNTRKELYLWLLDAEGGKGSLMEVEDTHVIYNFSEELNALLINLINSIEK